MPPSLSKLSPITFNTQLTHLGLKNSNSQKSVFKGSIMIDLRKYSSSIEILSTIVKEIKKIDKNQLKNLKKTQIRKFKLKQKYYLCIWNYMKWRLPILNELIPYEI